MKSWYRKIDFSLKIFGVLAIVVGLSGTPFNSQAEQADGYRLSEGHILKQVVHKIVTHYVEPGRIRPRMMLVKGTEWIQQTVAEVQVRHDLPPADYRPSSCQSVADCRDQSWPLSTPGEFECSEGKCQPIPAQMTIQAGSETQTFQTQDVRGPWDLTGRMCEIFDFLEENIAENIELPNVEYAAINGMLSTLDPHSNLLTPQIYEEMQMGTRGEFGGLGIVISMHPGQPCSGHLTIMEVMDGSPAQSVGLRRMDRIVRIGDQPTTCMDLSEAVSRMRGTPGTPVRIWIERGNERARAINITRAQIQIDSVESRMLQNNVGYVKIENFQINTTSELRAHLRGLTQQGMRSLILDLRDNPGGLLDQAIRVSDVFLTSGTIVVTAGSRQEDRESRSAQVNDTEPNYPIAVLINSGSASASEIVAGALRNHSRAIIVGETSFGKGSVQTLYEFDDGSALKLTVAQYLTPGEQSIQSVGIVPDLEFGAMTVERNRIDLDPRSDRLRESDLDQHFGHRNIPTEEAQLRLWLLRQESDNRSSQCPPQFRCDEEQDEPWSQEAVSFAQQLLASGPPPSRTSLIQAARRLVVQRQAQETNAVAAALRPMRVDWSAGEGSGSTSIQASISVGASGSALDAGEQSRLRVRVTNNGEATLYRLRGTTRSDNPLLHDHEFVFGRVNPGQSRTWEVPICVPAGVVSRRDPVTVLFTDQNESELDPARATLTINGLEHPTFSYGYQIIDSQGNGDGQLQLGERATLRLIVRDEGPGAAREAEVRLRNKAGDTVIVRSCRHQLGKMAVNNQRVVEAEIEVSPSHQGDNVAIELNISDQRLREAMVERLEIPIAQSGPAPAEKRSVVAMTADNVPVRESPSPNGRIIARASKNSSFRTTAQGGTFTRVDLGGGRPGWILTSQTKQGTRPNPRFTEVLANRPPVIRLTTAVNLDVQDESITISGEITDPDRVLDMYIFVGRRKPFYLSNTQGQNPNRLTFSADLPLEGGINPILIVARETSDLVSRRQIFVRRNNPDGSPIETRESRRR